MRRIVLLVATAALCGGSLPALAEAVPGAAKSESPVGAPPLPKADGPVTRPAGREAAEAPIDRAAERGIERRLTMESRGNVNVEAVLKVAPKAPPLPSPTGKIVRVRTAEELKKAIESAEAKSTILLADGTYRIEHALLKNAHGVTIRSESGDREKVILDGPSEGKTPERHWCIVVHGCHDFTIADLTIQNYEFGVYLYGDGDIRRPLIHNVKFRNIWVRGVKGTHAQRIWDRADNLLTEEQADKVRPRDGRIQYCLFMNDHPKIDAEDGFHGNYVSGIDMMWLKNWTISDNVFANIRGRSGGGRGAIFVWVNSEDVIAERNIIVNCDRGIAFGNPSSVPPHMTRGIARNNFILAGARQAIEFHQTVDTVACHNTVYGRDVDYRRTIEFQTGNVRPRLLNNLVHGAMYLQKDVEQNGNIVGDLEGWFANPQIGDFHLTDKAADALGKAIPLPEVKHDFDRQPRKGKPDVGADEVVRQTAAGA